MKKFGVLIQCIASLLIGYISSVYVAVGYFMMTNTGKLNNDPEGKGMLKFLGFFMLVIWAVIICTANYYGSKKLGKEHRKLVLCLSLVLVAAGVVIKIIFANLQ